MTDKTIRKIEDVGTKLVILVLCGTAILALTFFGFTYAKMIKDEWIRRAAKGVVYVAMAACALIGMKLSGMKIKNELDFGNPLQYLWGVAAFIPLSVSFTVLPMLLGGSIAGGHNETPFEDIVYYFVYYLVFVGPVEELIFRQYLQELLVDILPGWKWMGAVIAAVLFGVWHLVNGSSYQALLSTAVGLVLGLSKYFIKDCTLISVSMAHGLYDFFIVIFRIILMK